MSSPTAQSIEAFWAWWTQEGRARCDAAATAGRFDEVMSDLGRLIGAIEPGLRWEFGSGTLSRNVLWVSGGGDAALRSTSERWLMAAPPSDDIWEYRSARHADLAVFEPGVSVEVEGHSVDAGDLRLAVWVDDERQVVDVALWHPALTDAAPSVRHAAMSLMLDWLLGEDARERWIGHVELVDDEPSPSVEPLEFVAAVEQLERSHLEPTYAFMSGTIDDRPVIVIARRPLKRVEFPLFDLRMDARLLLDTPTTDGFPDPDLLDGLTDLEEDLSARLGDLGVLAAVVTHDGVRTFHVYCDQEGTAPAIGQAWVAAHADQTIVLSFELDPAWEAVAAFC